MSPKNHHNVVVEAGRVYLGAVVEGLEVFLISLVSLGELEERMR